MRKGIAAGVVEKFPFLRSSASQFLFNPGTIFAFWHEESQRSIYYLVSTVRCNDKPSPPDVANVIKEMRERALRNNVNVNAMPRLASGLDGLPWNEKQTMLQDFLWNSGNQIQVHYFPFFPQRLLSGPCSPGHNVIGVHNLDSLN